MSSSRRRTHAPDGQTKTRAPASSNGRSPSSIAARVLALAGQQHGVVARSQLIEMGMPVSTIDHRVRSGSLMQLHRGVYRIGPLKTDRTHILAAVLALPTSAVSHRSAAGLRQILTQTEMEPVDITIAGRRATPRPGIRLHHVVSLGPDDIGTCDGIPATSPARTLHDLATVLAERDLERAVAEAFALRIIDHATLDHYLAGRPDARGIARLRSLIAGETAPARTRSEAEERFLSLIRRAGIDLPAVNARVAGYEVDFFWRAEHLVVEVDGHAYHATRRKFESDRRRDAALIAGGLRVMRVTWQQLGQESERVLADVVRALARGGSGR